MNSRTAEQPNYELRTGKGHRSGRRSGTSRATVCAVDARATSSSHSVLPLRSSAVRLFGCSAVHSRSGSVLILALWVLFFLAALALAVGAHVSASLKLARFMREDVRGYHLARAGVTHAALQVACNTNKWNASMEDRNADVYPWYADPAVFSDQLVDDVGAFSIINVQQGRDGSLVTNPGLVGANSKLDLNSANRDVLALFFEQEGGLSDGEVLCKAIEDYKTEKKEKIEDQRGVEGASAGVSGDLESIYELFSVSDSVDDRFFAEIESYITVFNRTSCIDTNTASPVILDCFEECDVVVSGCKPQAYSGIVIGHTRSGGEAARIEFVIDARERSKGQRLYWHEF